VARSIEPGSASPSATHRTVACGRAKVRAAGAKLHRIWNRGFAEGLAVNESTQARGIRCAACSAKLRPNISFHGTAYGRPWSQALGLTHPTLDTSHATNSPMRLRSRKDYGSRWAFDLRGLPLHELQTPFRQRIRNFLVLQQIRRCQHRGHVFGLLLPSHRTEPRSRSPLLFNLRHYPLLVQLSASWTGRHLSWLLRRESPGRTSVVCHTR